jgi:hypothetical protein
VVAGGELPRAEPNHYQLLRLTASATALELRQAFRALSKLYHPDTTSLPAAEAEDRFQRLQLAYLTLSDPERRQAYDSQLRLEQLQRLARLPQPRPATPDGGSLSLRRLERPQSVRRALSGGEWFALLLLGLALAFSLVLGVGLAWWRGVELVKSPSWLNGAAAGQTAAQPGAVPGDDHAAPAPHAPVQPSPAGSRAVAG